MLSAGFAVTVYKDLKPGDDHAKDNDGDAKCSAAGDLFLENQDSHDEDPDEAGRGDAGHDRYRHMDQSHLIDHQSGEQ